MSSITRAIVPRLTYVYQSDAHLWDALRRSYLVEYTTPEGGEGDDDAQTSTHRFNLDTIIESEGANLSVGERSLLSLARALVKDSQVVGEPIPVAK